MSSTNTLVSTKNFENNTINLKTKCYYRKFSAIIFLCKNGQKREITYVLKFRHRKLEVVLVKFQVWVDECIVFDVK